MNCRHEHDVLHAAQSEQWPEALRRHLLECDDCVAAAAAAPWMTRFAGIGDRQHPLPDPQLVYLKARLLQASADAARVSRPITIVQMVAYLVVAAGWAGLLTWKWDVLMTWLRGFTPTTIVQNVASAESLSMSFFAVVFVLASMTAMLAMHTIMAEE